MEIKLKSGKTYKVNPINLDLRDELLDSIKYTYNKKGEVTGVEMMHSTMTKWLRICIKDITDDIIFKMPIADKTEIFTILQEKLMMGEGKASK
mgnify:CR=1 FL=1